MRTEWSSWPCASAVSYGPTRNSDERPSSLVVLDLCAQREQERGRVGMRVGEAEVASEGAHVPHPDVRDLAFHLRERRQPLEHER